MRCVTQSTTREARLVAKKNIINRENEIEFVVEMSNTPLLQLHIFFVYLFGKWVLEVAFSKALCKNEFTLVHNGNTHAWDTSIDPSLFQNCG